MLVHSLDTETVATNCDFQVEVVLWEGDNPYKLI
jgi:hypothetical protein